MNKAGILFPVAALLLSMPMMASVQADTSSQSATTISQNNQQNLQGLWVDTSGRGVLTFENGIAVFHKIPIKWSWPMMVN